MSEHSSVYRARAAEMRREAAGAALAEVRERLMVAAVRWDQLAEQGESVERARATRQMALLAAV
jgi:hypothetical protein